MKTLEKEEQATIFEELTEIAIEAKKLLALAKDEEAFKAYEEIAQKIVKIAHIVDEAMLDEIVTEGKKPKPLRYALIVWGRTFSRTMTCGEGMWSGVSIVARRSCYAMNACKIA